MDLVGQILEILILKEFRDTFVQRNLAGSGREVLVPRSISPMGALWLSWCNPQVAKATLGKFTVEAKKIVPNVKMYFLPNDSRTLL